MSRCWAMVEGSWWVYVCKRVDFLGFSSDSTYKEFLGACARRILLLENLASSREYSDLGVCSVSLEGVFGVIESLERRI